MSAFFRLTPFLLDRYEGRDPLAQEAKSLRAALKEYRAAKGAYPILPDRLTVDLEKELVRGGYLRSDSRPEPDSIAFDGKSYGPLFYTGPLRLQPAWHPVRDRSRHERDSNWMVGTSPEMPILMHRAAGLPRVPPAETGRLPQRANHLY